MNPFRRRISLLTLALPLLVGSTQRVFAADELFGEIKRVSPVAGTMTIDNVKYRYSSDVKVLGLDGKQQKDAVVDERYEGATAYFGARDGDPYPVITYLKPMFL